MFIFLRLVWMSWVVVSKHWSHMNVTYRVWTTVAMATHTLGTRLRRRQQPLSMQVIMHRVTPHTLCQALQELAVQQEGQRQGISSLLEYSTIQPCQVISLLSYCFGDFHFSVEIFLLKAFHTSMRLHQQERPHCFKFDRLYSKDILIDDVSKKVKTSRKIF